jgi:small redox-active disulfide protein 2
MSLIHGFNGSRGLHAREHETGRKIEISGYAPQAEACAYPMEDSIMKIEVLGPGCPKCNTVMENVKKALAELGKTAEVIKVTDINQMIERGVMSTPALIFDGKLMVQGKIPNVEQIKDRIQKGE